MHKCSLPTAQAFSCVFNPELQRLETQHLAENSEKRHQRGDLPDSAHRAAGEQSRLLVTLSVTAAVDVTHAPMMVTGTQPAH